jgi:uncharacterized protein YbjT (DUF2867 family)
MIVITTPTGQIGYQVLNYLLASSEQIRVIVRDPSHLPPHVRERVEVVQGSHSDPNVVTRAFAGAASVFWLVPPDPHAESVEAAYVGFSRPACDAFKSQGVKQVVGVSAFGRGAAVSGKAGYVTASLAMDDLIASTGVSYRALAAAPFMDNMLRQIASIKNQGVFFDMISGDLKQPTCATRDIATIAARLLLDHTWSGVESRPVLGPEDLSYNDMAQIMSEVLGRPVRYQQIPGETLKATLIRYGRSEAMAQGLVDMMAAYDQRMATAEPRTPESTTPTSFRQWCEEVLRPAILA